MSEPTPEQREEAVSIVELFNAFQVSLDADRIHQIYMDVRKVSGAKALAEPCDCLPDAIQAAVRQIQTRYWSVFPMETSLWAAEISMANHARAVRQKAKQWIPSDAEAILTALQIQMHDATAWLNWLTPERPLEVVYITDGGVPDATTND